MWGTFCAIPRMILNNFPFNIDDDDHIKDAQFRHFLIIWVLFTESTQRMSKNCVCEKLEMTQFFRTTFSHWFSPHCRMKISQCDFHKLSFILRMQSSACDLIAHHISQRFHTDLWRNFFLLRYSFKTFADDKESRHQATRTLSPLAHYSCFYCSENWFFKNSSKMRVSHCLSNEFHFRLGSKWTEKNFSFASLLSSSWRAHLEFNS